MLRDLQAIGRGVGRESVVSVNAPASQLKAVRQIFCVLFKLSQFLVTNTTASL